MFIYMIYVCCCYTSLRHPSDVGSTVTKCSCTLLIIGHTEGSLNQSRCIVLTLCMLVSFADNIFKGLINTQIRPDITWNYLDINDYDGYSRNSPLKRHFEKEKKGNIITREKLLCSNVNF